MTLALLLTAVTGAWADGTVTVKELTASEITAWANDDTNITAADLPGFVEATTEQAQSWDGYPTNGTVYLIYGFDNGEMKKITYVSGNAMSPSQNPKTRAGVYGDINRSTPERYFYVTGITGVVEPAIDVKWDAATKTGTFVMPAFDVEIAPIYAPVAQWAKVENVDQLPTAIEGIYAESTDAIVTAGTVAKIGETENVQGTLMYAVGTSATEQPALTAFSATLPTAEKIAAGDVYVWYYIKGADTPQGQTATAENTFNDSEICATPIKVTVLNNKFDINFNAANANTIEAGKATVTVGGAAATVTDGKLQGVKMGSEVKVKANTGYKFRKVVVEKKAEVLTITVAKGSTDLSGDKLLYYTPGETYRQAIANHPENKLDGGLGWNIWDGGNDATIFYKESTDKSRDLSIDGDQHFRPTDSINLDTVIDPTLNFYFVAQF